MQKKKQKNIQKQNFDKGIIMFFARKSLEI